MADSMWERFLEKGDILYEYLIKHYDNMFEPSGKIKRFDMIYMSMSVHHLYEGVHEECGEQIHKEIISWIHKERHSGRLFNKENWKPFRDQYRYTSMYYGYRKLFCFHNFFYFQLALLENRHDIPSGGLETSIDFNVSLYGWKEIDNKYIQPYNDVIINDDMMMPEKYWKWD